MELRDLYNERTEYIKEYRRRYKEKMISLVEECGLYGVDVVADGMRGVIQIAPSCYTDCFEIFFHPYTKNGSVSKNARYVGMRNFATTCKTDEEIKREIKSIFTLADQEGKV